MDYYQMPLFTKLYVSNIEFSEKWYRETLGFKNLFTFSDNNNQKKMIHLRKFKYQDLMLLSAEQFIVGTATFHTILVDNIEMVAQKIEPQMIVKNLQEEPWQAMELTIKDPDGHLITLTQPILSTATFEEVVTKLNKKMD